MKKFIRLFKLIMEDVNDFFNDKFRSYLLLIFYMQNKGNNVYFKKDEHIFKLFADKECLYYYKDRQKVILYYFAYKAWTDKFFQSVFPIYIFFKY